jgi:hypothetical protein
MLTDIIASISSFAAVAAMVISLLAHRANTREQTQDERATTTATAISVALKPTERQLTELSTALTQLTNSMTQLSGENEKSNTRIGSLMDRTAVLETKIELFWRNVAMDAAKILHQPDPRRAMIDALLEKFMAGTMSIDDENKLRGYLVTIRDYEPGRGTTDFPIRQGEQTAAAILLATMEHTIQGGSSK